MTAQELANLLDGRGHKVKRNGNGWVALCPCHEERTPSLSISDGNDRVLCKCHGCHANGEAVFKALGLSTRDLFHAPAKSANGSAPKPEIVETYDYHDADGTWLYQVCRLYPKTFRQRTTDDSGNWKWSVKGVKMVPYHLPRVLETIRAGGVVWIVEGEKDVHALEQHGFTATCNPGGAGKWRDAYSQLLAGAHCVILADADDPGRKHAQHVAQSLYPCAQSLAVVEPPAIGEIQPKDAAEYLDAGGDPVDLDDEARLAPDWQPPSDDRPIREPQPDEHAQGEEPDDQQDPTPAAVDGPRGAFDFAPPEPDAADELLRRRYLTRGGVLLLSAYSGVGKSVLAYQLAIAMGIGRPFLAFDPPRPLKVLVLQNENDDGEMGIMTAGILEGMGLSQEEIDQANANVIFYRYKGGLQSAGMKQLLRQLLTQHQADILILDPFFAFHDGDQSPKDIGGFYRQMLFPILHAHQCGCIVMHHFAKPQLNGANRKAKSDIEHAYDASGGAEQTNFARAVVSIWPTETEGLFEVKWSKRGGRLDRKPGFIKWGGSADRPYWIEAQVEIQSTTSRTQASVVGQILQRIPPGERARKNDVREWYSDLGVTQKAVRNGIEQALVSGALIEEEERVGGGYQRIKYLRRPAAEAPDDDRNDPQAEEDLQ